MIAASAIASFPFINTFSATSFTSLLNPDNAVRTHRRTGCARYAGCFVSALRRMVSLFIDLILRKLKDSFGAGIDAETAAFAFVCLKRQFSHIFLPFLFAPVSIQVSSASASGTDCLLGHPVARPPSPRHRSERPEARTEPLRREHILPKREYPPLSFPLRDSNYE